MHSQQNVKTHTHINQTTVWGKVSLKSPPMYPILSYCIYSPSSNKISLRLTVTVATTCTKWCQTKFLWDW